MFSDGMNLQLTEAVCRLGSQLQKVVTKLPMTDPCNYGIFTYMNGWIFHGFHVGFYMVMVLVTSFKQRHLRPLDISPGFKTNFKKMPSFHQTFFVVNLGFSFRNACVEA